MNGRCSPSDPPPAALLAPGFRFHPTDEELVSYYLKRKVLGRPLRIDAIAEVDLYKCEPWDLPSLSRLRSRDVEWYFFSPLDRKYSNKARTNRTTAKGYWKTTGKDREVRHRGRLVGMKKTLVFHSGRAPRGQRTNWVMHEYRLEGDELAQAGIPQDSYVVCRIFQKIGSGPQNGAQYGAPFVEEEWEEEAAEGLPVVEDGDDDEFNHVGDQGYLQMDDLFQNLDSGNRQETAPLALENGSNAEDLDFSVDEMLQDPSFIQDMVEHLDVLGQQNNLAVADITGENSDAVDLSRSYSNQTDGYIELSDLSHTTNVDSSLGEDSHVWASMIQNSQNPVPQVDGGSNLAVTTDFEEFLRVAEDIDQPEQEHLDVLMQGIHSNGMLDFPLTDDSYYIKPDEDSVVFYDASSNDVAVPPDDFVQLNELLYSPLMPPDDDLLYDIIGLVQESEAPDSCALESPDSAEEVNHISVTAVNATLDASEPDVAWSASSSAWCPEVHNQFSNSKSEIPTLSDTQKSDINNRPIIKRMVGMLGSISAPAALAEEFPAVPGKTIGPASVGNLTLSSTTEQWAVQEHGDFQVHLSYSVAGNIAGKDVDFEPNTKTHCGAICMMLRGSFCLFFLSALMLLVSYKVGMIIYGR